MAEVLKHGTLSVGFIGLAETLVALTGKHHGESEESYQLGYEIISYMRKRMDDKSQETGLNFTPVSYTHLDVYKRQIIYHAAIEAG